MVSDRKLRALALLGWRYSVTREAWVLRAGGGRRGPVFTTRRATDVAATFSVDEYLSQMVERALAPDRSRPPAGAPLPRREPLSTQGGPQRVVDGLPPRFDGGFEAPPVPALHSVPATA